MTTTIHLPDRTPAPVLRLMLAIAAHIDGAVVTKLARAPDGRFVLIPVVRVEAPKVVRWPLGLREVWTVCYATERTR